MPASRALSFGCPGPTPLSWHTAERLRWQRMEPSFNLLRHHCINDIGLVHSIVCILMPIGTQTFRRLP